MSGGLRPEEIHRSPRRRQHMQHDQSDHERHGGQRPGPTHICRCQPRSAHPDASCRHNRKQRHRGEQKNRPEPQQVPCEKRFSQGDVLRSQTDPATCVAGDRTEGAQGQRVEEQISRKHWDQWNHPTDVVGERGKRGANDANRPQHNAAHQRQRTELSQHLPRAHGHAHH